MGVRIDQSRRGQHPAAIDHPVRGGRRGGRIVRARACGEHRDDASVLDADVAAFDEGVMPVEGKDRDVSNQQ